MEKRIFNDKKKFGEVAVSLGLVSEEALYEALAYQEELKKKQKNVRLGEALIKLGYINPTDAFNIFQQQHSPSDQNEGRFTGQKLQGVQLHSFIGKGGMGEVYVGEQLELGRKVAVKFLSPALAADDQYVRRFLWEAQAAAKLDHHNIVQTYDVGAFEYTFYILMQYVEGLALSEMIHQQGRLPLHLTIDIMHQVSQGLASAHKSNIIHRDVKPENIMMTPDGCAKIMDFGLARSQEHYKGMTSTGQVMGTPEYISPEACKGEPIDARSDIYSLGITFYETLYGYPPFYGKSPMAVMLDHISTPAKIPDKYFAETPKEISKIIMLMLAKDPKQPTRIWQVY